MERTHSESEDHSAPKWAAVVDDTPYPMPRRRLKARDIAAQSGAATRILIRDYNQPVDIVLQPDDVIDLADGNVFRTAEPCENAAIAPPHGAVPKLAYFADDAWEVTVQPHQTTESLLGLFGLPDDAELVRDFESPADQKLEPNEKVNFADGPVFRVRIRSLTVKVNNQPVRFTQRAVTGLEVKQTAINQGVAIDVGCVLYRIKPEGGLGPAIGDQERLHLRHCDEFRCVAPDDNS